MSTSARRSVVSVAASLVQCLETTTRTARDGRQHGNGSHVPVLARARLRFVGTGMERVTLAIREP